MRKKHISLSLVLLLFPVAAFSQEKTEVITFTILHTPVQSVSPYKEFRIEATITDPRKVSYASVNYRKKGERSFKTVFMTNPQKDLFAASIPALDVVPPGIEYYIFVMDIRGVPHVIFRDPRIPQSVNVSAAGGLAPAVPGGAALEEEFALFAAEDVVYGAAKRQQRIAEAPASVSVLTDEDIEKLGITSVLELLRVLPGVDVEMLNPTYSYVGARGFARRGNLMLLLIDGREVNIEFLGLPYWDALPISIFDIKRIEVIRGPASSLYGANAFSGIINIVTKNPEDPGRGDVKAFGGNYTNAHGYASGSGVSDKFGARVAVVYDHENRWSKPDEPSIEGTKITAKVKYSIDKDKDISLDGGVTSGRILAFTVLGIQQTDGNFRYVKTNANYEDFKAQFYWTGIPIDRLVVFSPGIPTYPPFDRVLPEIHGQFDQYELYMQYAVPTGSMNRLLIGGSGRRNVFLMNVLPQKTDSEDRLGAFLQNEFFPIENLNLTLGYRFDWNSVTPIGHSPRAAIVYSPVKNHTVRLSYGLAFRKPVFFEYGFNLDTIKNLLNLSLSNPKLKNEELTTYEFGYILQPIEMLTLSSSLYYNQYRKFIEFIPQKLNYENVGNDADIYGGEIEAKAALTKNVKFFANFSYLRGIDQASAQQRADPFHLSPDESNPKYKAAAGLEWMGVYGLFGSLAVVEVDGYKMVMADPNNMPTVLLPASAILKLDPYTLINAKIGYRFFKNTFEVGAYGQNLLFTKYREFPGITWRRPLTASGTPISEDVYGGEEIGTKILGFVGAKF